MSKDNGVCRLHCACSGFKLYNGLENASGRFGIIGYGAVVFDCI